MSKSKKNPDLAQDVSGKETEAVELQEKDEQPESSDCEVKLSLLKEKFIRVNADFDNFRRRIEKERIEWMQLAQSQIVKDLLTVVDDFERALNHPDDSNDSKAKEWLAGFSLIGKALDKVLKQYGLQEISQTDDFDPMLHEAIVQIESEGHESGQIIEVLQKGYLFKDQVLRPARVSVAK